MSSTINASTASGGGVITSADASGILQLQTAGTPAVTINASQNVGIGTSSPGARLDVRTTLSTQATFTRTGQTAVCTLYQSTADTYLSATNSGANLILATQDTERMRLDSSGQQSSTIVGFAGTYNEYKCRAWVNFKGTGTVSIRASGNVSSITDGATGLYSVNFTTAMPDANYSVATSGTSLSEFSSDNPTQGPCIASLQTGTFDVYTGSNTTTKDDWIRVCIAVFR